MRASRQASPDPLDCEIEAFENMRGRLEDDHRGRWVVFAGRQFWKGESFGTFQDASHAARRAFGAAEVLIRQVGAAPDVRLPSTTLWFDDRDTEDAVVGS